MAAAPSGIVTPEAVVLEFETAGIASRMLAGLVDLTAQTALLMLVLAGGLGLGGLGLDFGGFASAAIYVALFLVLFGYPAGFESLWRGRTPGKAVLGLRVVTVEGAPIRFRHAAIRSIVGVIDKYVVSGPAVGLVCLLFSGKNQRLGDLVAGTIVLRERSGARGPSAVAFVPPRGLESYVATLDVSGLQNAEYGAVRSFLLRAMTLSPPARASLAQQLAGPLVQRQRTAPPPDVHPEIFLVCIAAAYQLRNGGPAAARRPTFTSVWADVQGPRGVVAARPAASTAPPVDGFAAPG